MGANQQKKLWWLVWPRYRIYLLEYHLREELSDCRTRNELQFAWGIHAERRCPQSYNLWTKMMEAVQLFQLNQ